MMEPTDHDPTYEAAPCPDCDGSGTVDVDRVDRRGEHYTVEVPCETCNRGLFGPDAREAAEDDRDPWEDREVDWEAPW